MSSEAIILAGGFGTRLRGVVDDLPKPMAPVAGKPFLEYLLQYLLGNGINHAILATGFMHQKISGYFGNDFRGMKLDYSVENEPLGTGGAIAEAMRLVKNERVFVVNGDTFFGVHLDDFAAPGKTGKYKIIVALKPMKNFDRYGAVSFSGNTITSFHEKRHRESGHINGGIYLLDKSWFLQNSPSKVFSFEKDILERHLDKGITGCLVADEYFIDIGIPEDYTRAINELPLKFRSFPL
ncbi:MAG: nucleotidyltransferase family protein [Bacteroidales bacterium]